MSNVCWLVRRTADVPSGDEWLSPVERQTQHRFVITKRRDDWRLGRWTAKAAVASTLRVDPARVSVVAADDGAPEALLDGGVCNLSLSISHRGGTGLAVVGTGGTIVGGDLEVIEPRTDVFVREWFSPAEQDLVAVASAEGRHDEMACLVWSLKEAAAKVLREGLRLDVRQAVVSFDDAGPADGWRSSKVDWVTEQRTISGWWRIDGALVTTVASEPASSPPTELTPRSRP